ncbi:Glucosamine 6-phosphate N-acetyltransferase [Toxocara canis]|uniref:Glucosamine 6-phosphate N-acetyltransferase n=1 Tax=Toxocara canis TaxID=6265 RepID=A0A0B2W126_TOXCA|nr:Glucosamine 6-phosphate N-acetyltransferase [Toxocara canis]
MALWERAGPRRGLLRLLTLDDGDKSLLLLKLEELIGLEGGRLTDTFWSNGLSKATEMFPSDLLLSLELPLSAPKLPEDLMIRPLRIDDYNRGYLQLLSQLTSVGDVSEEQFQKRFVSMQNTHPKGYYVVVLEEPSSGMIVGSATLVIEWKFIHEAGCRGRTEDVVVDKRMRGRQLGKILNFYLVQLARRIGVYKLSLECKDALIPFYEQFGFKLDQGNNFLVQRFK